VNVPGTLTNCPASVQEAVASNWVAPSAWPWTIEAGSGQVIVGVAGST
jgi:hypothetical protein